MIISRGLNQRSADIVKGGNIMETGSDGRFYDWHYDNNDNGMLEISELMDYEYDTFGSHSSGSSGSSGSSSSSGHPAGWESDSALVRGLAIVIVLIYAILAYCLVIGGIIMLILVPPVGAFMIYLGTAMSSRLK